jgi:hypothetical protein
VVSGEDGFEKIFEEMGARVARIEREMGVYDLHQFTPGDRRSTMFSG